jgi:hypothetical protein
MRLKSPAVSMAFFKVAAGKPVITVPLPTRAGNGVPSAKTVPGADTKICHLTEPEFNTPYKGAQMRASFSFNHACSVVLNCTSKQKKLLFLLRTSKKIKIAEFKHTRFRDGFCFDDACWVHCCCFFLRASRKSRFYQNKQIEPSSLILFYKWGVGGERFGDTSLCWKWIPIAQFWTSEKPMLVMVAEAAKAYGCSCGVPFK